MRHGAWVLVAAVAAGPLVWSLWPLPLRPPADGGRALASPAPAASRPPVTPPLPASPPRAEAPPSRAGAPPLESRASPSEASALRGAAVDWERIPLDATTESLGDLGTRKAFTKGVAEKRILSRCVEAWDAPRGIAQVDMKFELRVRSVDDALVITDASILESNVGSAELERCVLAGYRDLRIPAPGIQPGLAFRLRWGGTKNLR